MNYNINSYITPQTAAKLLITDEIDLLSNWSDSQTKAILDALLAFSIDDIIKVVESNPYTPLLNSGNIPQFGKVEKIIRVPNVMISERVNNVDYVQMGFLLKKDPKASVLANQKFGENYGKVAAQTGLINCISKRFVPSTLTETYVNRYDNVMQYEILKRLLFRIPIIQVLIQDSKDGKVNGYNYMKVLATKTQDRRSSCTRNILNAIKRGSSEDVVNRINNIVWQKEGEKNETV